MKILKCLLITTLLSCAHNRIPNATRDEIIFSDLNRINTTESQAQGSQLAISTQGIYATQAAKYIYEIGGNAIDAAVAASFVLGVERPHSTGIGGGGFMIYRNGADHKIYAIDFRERAPLKADAKMYLNKKGDVIAKLSQNGALASGTPGLVAGLLEIHHKFGKLPRQEVLAPAILMAQKGIRVYPSLAKALKLKLPELIKDPEARRIFLDKNLQPLKVGDILVQLDLARTLDLISKQGAAGFYHGKISRAICDFSKKNGGILTEDDFSQYSVKWREPLHGTYKGADIFSMPPPSSGGVHVIEFLNILENDDMKNKYVLSPQSLHLAASALQSVFADRARYLGDPDFSFVPTSELISKSFAKRRREDFLINQARSLTDVQAGEVLPNEHSETTHLSIMDASGDVVSSTQTINGYMGASVVVPGTGIVLNNEMDDFAAAVGASNLFGAIGGEANLIAPKKTPLSSMSPTIILKNESPLLSIGAPGGTRIISCVAQSILNYLEFKLPIFESIATVRYHHQWQPDILEIEPPGPTKDTIAKLVDMGYNLKINPIICNVMAVAKEENLFKAVSDPRDMGTAYAK